MQISDSAIILGELQTQPQETWELWASLYHGGCQGSLTSLQAFIHTTTFLYSDKVCEKLKKTDRQICELTYEKQIDFSTVDLKKLKVKDLKKILSEWDEVGTLLFLGKMMFWQNLFSGVWWLPGEGRLHQADRGAEAKACPHWALRRPSDICDFFYDGAHKQFGLPDMPNA